RRAPPRDRRDRRPSVVYRGAVPPRAKVEAVRPAPAVQVVCQGGARPVAAGLGAPGRRAGSIFGKIELTSVFHYQKKVMANTVYPLFSHMTAGNFRVYFLRLANNTSRVIDAHADMYLSDGRGTTLPVALFVLLLFLFC